MYHQGYYLFAITNIFVSRPCKKVLDSEAPRMILGSTKLLLGDIWVGAVATRGRQGAPNLKFTKPSAGLSKKVGARFCQTRNRNRLSSIWSTLGQNSTLFRGSLEKMPSEGLQNCPRASPASSQPFLRLLCSFATVQPVSLSLVLMKAARGYGINEPP